MKLSSTVILFFYGLTALGQPTDPVKGDFIFPIRPQQENYLSGTMGELRSSHFHTGLDIKTSGITGLPVYATADGYVQRIRVSTGGYGNALYMAHPHNGTVSVYAHLETFDPAIAAFIRAKQYENESFEVNLFPDKSQFSFKQGDIIAWSGNSGSSSGPHLHFEIRTAGHRAIDPLRFGFDEIKDSTPPILDKIAFVTKDINARVNGEFGRHEFEIELKDDGKYAFNSSVYLQGLIGVEIYAYDRFDGARNRNGVLYQSLILDGNEVFRQSMDSLKFNMAKSIFVHTNYKRSVEGGRRFNKLYVDQGNELHFYRTDNRNGILKISDPLPHEMEIRLSDSYGNISQFVFDINDSPAKQGNTKVSMNLGRDGYDIHDNIVEFKVDLSNHGYCEALVFINGEVKKSQMAYDKANTGYYLWDLRDGLPDSILLCDDRFEFDFSAMIPSSRKTIWNDDFISIVFPKKSLFDTAYLRYKYDLSDQGEFFRFNNITTPVQRNFTVTLIASKVYDPIKSAVYAVDSRGRLSYLGGNWNQNKLTFRTKELADFTIATDLDPPKISTLRSGKDQLKFRVLDEMSGIKEIRAELDGRWLLMNYDAKSNTVWTDAQVVMAGHFTLMVTDYAENGTVFEADY